MRLGLMLLCCLSAAQLAAYAQTPPAPPAEDTIVITRAEFDALRAAVEKLQQEVQRLRGEGSPVPAVPAPAAPDAPPAEVAPPPPEKRPTATPGPHRAPATRSRCPTSA